jgi:hypothetical protein
VSRQAASGPVLALVRPLVEGVLRLAMGLAGVVERLPLLHGSSARGIELEVEALGQRAARLVMRTSGVRETRPSAEAWAGAIDAILLLVGTEPRVEVVAVEPDDRESRVVLFLGR